MKLISNILYAIMVVQLATCSQKKPVADYIFYNAKIWTASEKNATAQAMAIAADTILAIGSKQSTQVFKGPQTEMINLNGQFVTPGFIDSHVHLMTGGRSLLSVDLRDAGSPEEFAKRIANFAKKTPAKEWILEGNWDHTLWGGELPHKDWIDTISSQNPVALFRLDWHMLLANSAALNFAGIDKNTPNVEGGTIVRDEQGNLTGVLKDNAMNLLLDKIPPMSTTQKESAFKAAVDYFISNGVTSVHDVDGLNTPYESYSTAKQFLHAGKLPVRIYAAKPLQEWEQLTEILTTEKDNDKDSYKNAQQSKWLKIGGVKGFVDGSLGSHTAAFHNHYTDKADDKGFFIHTENNLYQWISKADKADLHILVHAIGDRAVHSLLNIYERVINENGDKDRRFRIEHAQHLSPADINRFAELNVIASMQPYHAIDDGRWAENYIGAKRIQTTYAFQALLNTKATLAFGSDWAVAPASPIMGIYAAVTRRTLDGKNPDGWVPEQKISVKEALLAYTRNAAYASFDEDLKGTLEVGKLADFVVLSENLYTLDAHKIKDVKNQLIINKDFVISLKTVTFF